MVRFGSTRHGACCTVRLRGWVAALRAQVPGNGGLTSRSSRCRFAARLNSGVRPSIEASMKTVILVLMVSLAGCASVPPEKPVFFCDPEEDGQEAAQNNAPGLEIC